MCRVYHTVVTFDEGPLRVEAVGKRVYDLGEAPGFLAGTVEVPVDTGSAA